MPEDAGGTFLRTLCSLPLPPAWRQLRESAKELIRVSPLPTKKHEDWKYLDLNPVYSRTFRRHITSATEPHKKLEPSPTETAHSRLIFVDGVFNPRLSDTSAINENNPLPGGIFFSSLAKTPPDALQYLGRVATPGACDFFANLNTAYFEDCAVIHIADDNRIDIPLHIVFLSNASMDLDDKGSPISFPRVLVVLEPGARAHLVEEYRGQGNYMTSAVVEIALGKGARLLHDRVQNESPHSFHFCTLHATLSGSASYHSTTVSLGGALSRHNPKIALMGGQAELELNGLSMIGGSQTADTHSLIDHAAPDCTSEQLQKYIIDGSAHGIFNGQIIVRRGAQRTNAGQSSRNLLLTGSARVDTKPQLEIRTDDVKCAHGAAVGQLDPDEMFYLQSRGLDPASARDMLTAGFAADVLNRLALPSLKNSLS